MEAQKIVNLLEESSDEELSEFAKRKWYIINEQNNGQYGEGGENDSTIKFETEVIKPWNYNTSRNNMLENPLLYARLSLQVVYC